MPEIPRKDKALGLTQTQTVSGPITAYDPMIARRMLEAIAAGATRKQIARDPSLPAFETFIRWALLDENLRKAWKEARQISAYVMEDEALEKAALLASPEADDFSSARIRAFEVAMQQWNRSAAIRDKAEFGEKAQQQTIVPVQINTTLDLGNGVTPHMPTVGEVNNIYTYTIEPPQPAQEQPADPLPEDIADTPHGPAPEALTTDHLAAKPKRGRPPAGDKPRTASNRLTPKNTSAKGRPRKSRLSEVLDK